MNPTSKGECCEKCKCGIVGNECGECHYPGCSCHSRVESGWEEWVLTLANSTNPRDKELLIAKVKVLLEEQIALTRREVLEKLYNEVTSLDVVPKNADPSNRWAAGYLSALFAVGKRIASIQDKLK